MDPKRLDDLQALLARHAKDWDFERNPTFHAPLLPDHGEPSATPDPAGGVTFTMRRGEVVDRRTLAAKRVWWIEAEGHVIEAMIYEDGTWSPFPALVGEPA